MKRKTLHAEACDAVTKIINIRERPALKGLPFDVCSELVTIAVAAYMEGAKRHGQIKRSKS